MNPAGRVIYIGKGTPSRARDLSPSRRTLYHRNAIQKHCRPVLVIVMVACASEQEAFALEKRLIAQAREAGHKLCNFTDGGEGASGRKKSQAEIERLRQLTLAQWDRRGRKPVRDKSPVTVNCVQCGVEIVRSYKSRKVICSKRCESEKFRRPYIPSERPPGVSGVRGVYPTRDGNWKAGVTVNKQYRHLGTFATKEAAIAARASAIEN